ncbi:hypothetical protein E2C01_037644 [Portunus trituberculatus]|uniref:Uncharacterized protein n=1 Tax=Portunus trituberculatus TaxID=210409 RepID=A0A5B7FEK9_PORTR|nr:hypothetical protein [Portunus trituberculatus]
MDVNSLPSHLGRYLYITDTRARLHDDLNCYWCQRYSKVRRLVLVTSATVCRSSEVLPRIAVAPL